MAGFTMGLVSTLINDHDVADDDFRGGELHIGYFANKVIKAIRGCSWEILQERLKRNGKSDLSIVGPGNVPFLVTRDARNLGFFSGAEDASVA